MPELIGGPSETLPVRASETAPMELIPTLAQTNGQSHSDPNHEPSLPVLLGMVRRHWLMSASIVLASVIIAYVVTRATRPVFEASTTLYFAERESSIPALDILNDIENGNSEVATEMEVMRARALAEAVIDTVGMQVTVTEPRTAATTAYLRVVKADAQMPTQTFEFTRASDSTFGVHSLTNGTDLGPVTVGAPINLGNAVIALERGALNSKRFEVEVTSRDLALQNLFDRLKVTRPNITASVVKVSYTDHDPVRTRDVPNALARTYLLWRSNLRKSGDRSTVEFLKEQIDTIASQLFAAEEALRRFRQENQVVDLPGQAQTQVQRLAALEAQRADIDIQRGSLRNLVREVKSAPNDPRLGSPYRRLMAFPGLMTSSNPALPLLETLTSLEQRRSDLLLRRTTNDPDVKALTDDISSVESQIRAVVETYLTGLDEQSNSLTSQINQFRGQAQQVPRKEVEYARLDRTESGLTQIYTMLQTRLREAQIAEAVDDGSVRVVDRAAIPSLPIAPKPLLNLLAGALLGILAACAAVAIREGLDHTVHTKEDVEGVLGSGVLALIPHIGEADRAKYFERWKRISRQRVKAQPALNGLPSSSSRLLVKDTQSVAAEAFRMLRTNITFARPDAPPKVLIFTSPSPGDGKSTSTMNLAIALVQQGKRVLVVDADMRRGGLHSLLKAERTPGLSEVLVGQSDLLSAVQSLALESFGYVDLIPTGSLPPNPAELLASPAFRALMDNLRTSYDAILLDSPPINSVTDAAIIGRETDGAVIVARAAKTTHSELAHAIGQLRRVQVPVTGIILNDYDSKRDARYNANYYGYSYEYKPYRV